MIKARASGSKVYLYFMKKGRQARHRIPRNSCFRSVTVQFHIVFDPVNMLHCVLTPPGSPYMYVRYLFSSGARTQFSGVFSRDLRLC